MLAPPSQNSPTGPKQSFGRPPRLKPLPMLTSKACCFFIGALWLVFPALISAQEPITVPPLDLYSHSIGEPSLIHSSTTFGRFGPSDVTLKIVVDEQGNVVSARPVNGPPRFFKQAQEVEIRRKFKPFKKDGVAFRATFEDTVYIVPPERWIEPRVPFPQVKDWNSLRIRLERDGYCWGNCPRYSVEVQGDGQVEFDGSLQVMTPGHHHGRISKQAVRDLVAAFRRAKYFSLLNQYVYPISDSPKTTTAIEFDGRKKSVLDQVGTWRGLPEIARQLENSIDELAGTEKWVKGNSQTGPALLAEGWNFQADTKENRALFANVAARGSQALIQLCINQSGLPKTLLSCSLESAAARGDLPVIRLLINKGVDPNDPPCSIDFDRTVLMNAAQSGKVDVVREILKYHPDVNAKFGNDEAALAFFLERSPPGPDTPKILRLLIAAGADVNNRDREGQTPIFKACSQGAEAVHILAQAGANINAKDGSGQTALMSCSNLSSVRAMIEAGADLTIRNADGLTAAQKARKNRDLPRAILLESAMKARAHP